MIRKQQQKRPKSSKTYSNNSCAPSNSNEGAVLNLAMKNYYQEYEKLKSLIQLPEKLPLEEYKTATNTVNFLFGQWNDPTDFCSSYPQMNYIALTNKNKSPLISSKILKEDYMKRLKRGLTEKKKENFDDGGNYLFGNNNNQTNIQLEELSPLKETGKSEDEDYQYDFDYGQDNNKEEDIQDSDINNNDKEEEEEEHYSFNDKEETGKDNNSNNHYPAEANEDEEYRFDGEHNGEGDQNITTIKAPNNYLDANSDNIQEEISEENVFVLKEQYSKPEEKKIKAQSMSKSNEENKGEEVVIEEEDFNNASIISTNNHNQKQVQKEKDAKSNREQLLSPSNAVKPNRGNKPSEQASFQQFTNDFFEDTNDKVILDEFEKKIFNKESNFLQFDNKSIIIDDAIVYSEKKANVIQRFWKKLCLNRILNKKRLKLISEFDKTNKYIIFIYVDKVNSKKQIECLFVRIYCIEKMKTLFDWFSINDLMTLGIIGITNDNDNDRRELSISAFPAIKDKLKGKIVELIIDQNIRKETEGK